MHGEQNPEAPRGRDLLKNLLSERNQYPDRVSEIDERIRDAFERPVAILMLDMCGFSRLTLKHGIIGYLAMIEQMDTAARPAVAHNRGTVIKQEADNILACFETAADALEAARDIFAAFVAINSVVPSDRDIYGSIGIGYGKTLVIGDEDLFGSEMNLTCKLGEDLAEQMEILLTAAAHRELPENIFEFEPVVHRISGVEIECYRFMGNVKDPLSR